MTMTRILQPIDKLVSSSAGCEVRQIGVPLSRIPVRHTCGHFEARLTRWNGDQEAIDRGHLQAGNKCTVCAPHERPEQPQFLTLEAVQQHCETENAPLLDA